jgi:kynurenine 3-monooxygenase
VAVTLYERRPDLRKVDMDAGRSINLALADRGIHALRRADAYADVAPLLIPMRGRMLHAVAGTLTKVSTLVSVAMIEKQIAHHGMAWSARK